MKKTGILLTIVLSFALLITGCSQEGGLGSTGDFALSITDAPVNNVDKVMVTLKEVQAIREADGEEIKETIYDFSDVGGTKTFNLLDLRFNEELLGQKQLPTGTYKQLRLIVAGEGYDKKQGKPEKDNTTGRNPANLGESYVVYNDETEENIFIPSGTKTGLKINHTFTIEEGKTVRLLLDADVREFMHAAGKSGKIILRSTALDITDKVVSGNIKGRVFVNVDADDTFDEDEDGSPDETLNQNNNSNDYDVVVEAKQDGTVVKSTVATVKEVDGEPAGTFMFHGLTKGDYTLSAKVVEIKDDTVNEITKYQLQSSKTVTVEAETTNQGNVLKINQN